MGKDYTERIALLKMTYGDVQKINSCLYITKRESIDGTFLLLNANTGEVLEKRYNLASAYDGHTLTGVIPLNSELTITLPQYLSPGDFSLRFYDRQANMVFEIENCTLDFSNSKAYQLKNKHKQLILLGSAKEVYWAAIYDSKLNKITKVIRGIVNCIVRTRDIYSNNEICIIYMNERGIAHTLRYTYVIF